MGSSPRRWTAALIAVTFIWGSTFVVVKEAVDRVPVFVFNTWRFAIAALVLGVLVRRELRALSRGDLVRGVLLGIALWAGYAFQTFGLTLTTAAKAGFITGMFVVFTPILQALLVRTRPAASALAAVLLAMVGLGLLSLEGSLVPALGDLLVLGCAFAFALHIVGLGAWSPGRSAAALATVQLGVSAVLHGLGGLVESGLTGTSLDWMPSGGFVWISILFTAVLASAVAFTVQTAAQAVLPPTRAAVILTTEPVFAWLTAWLGVPLLLWLGMTGLEQETFGLRDGAGAALVFLGMLVAELRATESDDALGDPVIVSTA